MSRATSVSAWETQALETSFGLSQLIISESGGQHLHTLMAM